MAHFLGTVGRARALRHRMLRASALRLIGLLRASPVVRHRVRVEWRNARITLSWMVSLLIAIFAGVLAIAWLSGVVPEASQIMLS
jgi:hypothetical protein